MILLVEDNPINQRVALRLLNLLGYEVDVAENGEEALQLMEGRTYDAILMDLQMPVMDGLTATRAIRDLETPASSTPIIALTANAFDSEREKCLAAGMNDFLTKPIQKDKFVASLARWTSGATQPQKLSA